VNPGIFPTRSWRKFPLARWLPTGMGPLRLPSGQAFDFVRLAPHCAQDDSVERRLDLWLGGTRVLSLFRRQTHRTVAAVTVVFFWSCHAERRDADAERKDRSPAWAEVNFKRHF
jgi:hypothetical protein